MKIRSFEERDQAALWSMLEPVFRAGDTYAIDPEISRDDALTYWTAAPHRAFMAEDGETLGSYYIQPNQGGGGAHVCNCGFVTSPAAQGKGVARAMLAHALEEAKASGFLAMQFNFVVESNARAVTTWERAGFEIVGRLPKAFRHPQLGLKDALVMYRML